MFLRLEISWFLAASPMYLLLGPKPTRDLPTLSVSTFGQRVKMEFLRSGAVGDFIRDLAKGQHEEGRNSFTRLSTYDIDTAIPRNSNAAVERAQIYAYDRHPGGMAGYVRLVGRVREMRVVPAGRKCVSGVRERCDGPLEKVVFV